MQYRILVEAERSGKKWYYPQKRYWWFFWKYITINDEYRVGYKFLEDAKDSIEADIKCREQGIIKKEYIKYP